MILNVDRNEIIHYLAKILDEILTGTKPIVDQIIKEFTETSNKISEMYKTKVSNLHMSWALIVEITKAKLYIRLFISYRRINDFVPFQITEYVQNWI